MVVGDLSGSEIRQWGHAGMSGNVDENENRRPQMVLRDTSTQASGHRFSEDPQENVGVMPGGVTAVEPRSLGALAQCRTTASEQRQRMDAMGPRST